MIYGDPMHPRLAMIILLLFGVAAICSLLGCATKPPVDEPRWKFDKDCLPQAIAMTKALRDEDVKARVLLISAKDAKGNVWGHAVSNYLYPPGKNQMWIWDTYWASVRTRAWWDDPEGTARAWLRQTRNPSNLMEAETL